MATSLSIKGKTQANDAVTSTINYVNPNATDAQLVSLATAMNNMTTNSVVDITKIDKNSLINKVEKQERNLQIEPSTINPTTISTDLSRPSTFNLTGADISAAELRVVKPSENNSFIFLDWTTDGESGIIIYVVCDDAQATSSSNIIFEFPETDTYKAASVTLQLQKT